MKALLAAIAFVVSAFALAMLLAWALPSRAFTIEKGVATLTDGEHTFIAEHCLGHDQCTIAHRANTLKAMREMFRAGQLAGAQSCTKLSTKASP